MTQFYKVSRKQFEKDCELIFHYPFHPDYEAIKHPIRTTRFSAGYDIFAPYNFVLHPGDTMTVPTGFKIEMNPHQFLMIVPRSGLGFKYQLCLCNTVGVIDADYYDNPSNEGHIMVKVVNRGDSTIQIEAGQAFCQGIIMSYDTCDDDNVLFARKGGLGSTDNKEVSV